MIKKAKNNSSKISQTHTGILVLENKKVFKGIGIGYEGVATGEVCFNTSLTGYQEIISDLLMRVKLLILLFLTLEMLEQIMRIMSQIKSGLEE